jgi:SGNH hydrolase-like domain, acetyltransferase AlgX
MERKTAPVSTRGAAKVLGIVLLMVCSLLATLALVEGTLRLVPNLLPEGTRLRLHWREDEGHWYQPHPYIGHLHQADGHASAHTARPGVEAAGERDPWGFRNRWPWPARVDIVAVGDSFTYSQMVPDAQAWTTLLAQGLPQRRVLNLGLIGAAPQQYLRVYETFGIARAPKVLLVGLFLANDLWGAQEFEQWWEAGGQGPFPEFGKRAPVPGVRGWMRQHVKRLYVYALAQDVRDSYHAGRLLSGKTIALATGERLQLVPSLLAHMATRAQPESREWTLVLDTLEQIQARAQAQHTQLLVLFFPSKEEVYLPVLGEQAADLAAPFIPELRQRGIAYLDLGPAFRERAAAGETLFFEVDGHPNARGYAVIAEAVLTYLKAHAQPLGLGGQPKPAAKADAS